MQTCIEHGKQQLDVTFGQDSLAFAVNLWWWWWMYSICMRFPVVVSLTARFVEDDHQRSVLVCHDAVCMSITDIRMAHSVVMTPISPFFDVSIRSGRNRATGAGMSAMQSQPVHKTTSKVRAREKQRADGRFGDAAWRSARWSWI